jgi:integrase/recombinase XerD
MPNIRPRTKLPKNEQLSQPLEGELATYEQVGLFTHPVTKKTAYRYKGCLLQYQQALNGATPTVETTIQFLAHLRKQGFASSSLRLYRAALQGFHNWRGEQFTFPIKVPHHVPEYTEPSIVAAMLHLSKDEPKDHLILRLLADAGLRRLEATKLRVRNVGTKAIRLRGKEDRDRTIPLTPELASALKPFCANKFPNDLVLGVGEGVIYRVVKKYGRLVGKPELKPHDLRHAFATRLRELGIDLRIIQELLGHSQLDTTQIYIQVAGVHLEDAISSLSWGETRDKPKKSNRVRRRGPPAKGEGFYIHRPSPKWFSDIIDKEKAKELGIDF